MKSKVQNNSVVSKNNGNNIQKKLQAPKNGTASVSTPDKIYPAKNRESGKTAKSGKKGKSKISKQEESEQESENDNSEDQVLEEEDHDTDDESQEGEEDSDKDVNDSLQGNEAKQDDSNEGTENESDDDMKTSNNDANKSAYLQNGKTQAFNKIVVKNLGAKTTEGKIHTFFAKCGEIESVSMGVASHTLRNAFITFTEPESVSKALELHNSDLNGLPINVHKFGVNAEKMYRSEPTIAILNNDKLSKEIFTEDKIQSIFAECGPIKQCDLKYSEKIVAFVVFQTSDSMVKALELNNKTVDDVKLSLKTMDDLDSKTAVYVQNVSKDVVAEDIEQFFENSGKIKHINLTPGNNFCIVEFEDTEGYCNAFLRDEDTLKGSPVFIEPFSRQKKFFMFRDTKAFHKKKQFGNKRPFPQHPKGGKFPSKKFKKNV